jgi:hypothetical protein
LGENTYAFQSAQETKKRRAVGLGSTRKLIYVEWSFG